MCTSRSSMAKLMKPWLTRPQTAVTCRLGRYAEGPRRLRCGHNRFPPKSRLRRLVHDGRCHRAVMLNGGLALIQGHGWVGAALHSNEAATEAERTRSEWRRPASPAPASTGTCSPARHRR